CLITSNLGEVVRARYVNLLFGQSVQADREELVRDLNSTLSLQPARSPIGIQVAPGSDQQAHVAAGFTSLYLLGAAEPTLTEFLEQHDDVIRRVFHAEEIFYQQELPWQEGNSEPSEESIQPDILVRRLDGTWIIIEFKLPLLDRQRITKRERRRRGFIDAVDEGISQLFNYQDYFSFPANREVARSLLGQSPSTPELVLVVGNSENVNGTEVREAQRSRRPFVLIDYDSLIGLYMAPLP